MKRTQARGEQLDVSPVIRTIQYLDEVLKRGVVIGVYEDSMQVSDEDVQKAIKATQAALAALTVDMERCLRMAGRLNGNLVPFILQ